MEPARTAPERETNNDPMSNEALHYCVSCRKQKPSNEFLHWIGPICKTCEARVKYGHFKPTALDATTKAKLDIVPKTPFWVSTPRIFCPCLRQILDWEILREQCVCADWDGHVYLLCFCRIPPDTATGSYELVKGDGDAWEMEGCSTPGGPLVDKLKITPLHEIGSVEVMAVRWLEPKTT